MMRYSASEKMELIKLVENSSLSISKTLKELQLSRKTFYNWYSKYVEYGYDGLKNNPPSPKKFWNKIPDCEKKYIVQEALNNPEKSPRELAFHITDNREYFISESSVYRILKAQDLITSPAYIVMSAKDKYENPTKRVNEMWQTDFTYFKITGWGWYYLSTILDDFSRYIIHWKLFSSMKTNDVQETLDEALIRTGISSVKLKHKPRLLSDNGPCYISKELKAYMEERQLKHIHSAPCHPMTQGKIERYHKTLKNVVNLQNYYLPGDLEKEIAAFVKYYNNERYHESLKNVTPSDVYFGRHREIYTKRHRIKQRTLSLRRSINLKIS